MVNIDPIEVGFKGALIGMPAELFFLLGDAVEIDAVVDALVDLSGEEADVEGGAEDGIVFIPLVSPLMSGILEKRGDEGGDVPWVPAFGEEAAGDELNAGGFEEQVVRVS